MLSVISDSFMVSNGVRQGSMLSPYLFNVVYMDDLGKLLNKCKVGCLAGDRAVNYLMYADDLVLLSPSSKSLSELLHKCQS